MPSLKIILTIQLVLTIIYTGGIDTNDNGECPQGSYYDANFGDCLWCDDKCGTCVGSSENCTTCKGLNRDIINNCQCTQGFIPELGECIKYCRAHCEYCDKSTGNCQSCYKNQNRYINEKSHQCTCQDGYLEENSNPVCTRCYKYKNNCYLECPNFTREDGENFICVKDLLRLNKNTQDITFKIMMIMMGAATILICFCGCLATIQEKYKEWKKQKDKTHEELNEQDTTQQNNNDQDSIRDKSNTDLNLSTTKKRKRAQKKKKQSDKKEFEMNKEAPDYEKYHKEIEKQFDQIESQIIAEEKLTKQDILQNTTNNNQSSVNLSNTFIFKKNNETSTNAVDLENLE